MKTLGTLVLVSLVLFTSPLLWAQPSGGRCTLDGRTALLSELKLSPAQQKLLGDFQDKRLDVQKLTLELKIKKIELNQKLRDPQASDDAVKAQLEQVNAAQAKINNSRVENLLILRKNLSSDQFRTLLSHVSQKMRKAKYHGKGGNWKQGRGPTGGAPMEQGPGRQPGLDSLDDEDQGDF